MYSENAKNNFKNQHFYIGIDVHKNNWTVTIRSNQMELNTLSMNPSPIELFNYMNTRYPQGIYISSYEAGFCGFWIHRDLERYGFHNYVVNAADIPTTHKEKNHKTDKIDSRKIARELEKKNLKGIYIPDVCLQQLRSLCRLRDKAVKHQTRIKNRIKGHLYIYGIKIPSHHNMPHWSGRFIQWLHSLSFEYEPARDYLLFCLEELKQQRLRIANITKRLKHNINHLGFDPIFRLLLSVPGIGTVLAITFLCEVMDIHRFKKFDQFKSFVGLIPSVENSGERNREYGLTKRRNRMLRYLIIEAAWVAVRKDPALLLAYNRLINRMKSQDAIVRIAKKLLNRIYYVWKNEICYIPAIVQ
jgi:transposase